MYIEEDEQNQENNSLIYKKDESSNQPDFFQQIQNINRNQSEYLGETIKQLEQQFQRNEEQHKQHLIHLETVGMMTKYQLVFTKMEAAILKIAHFLKLKDNQNKFQALIQIRHRAKNDLKDLALNSKTILFAFQKKIFPLYYILEDKVYSQQQKVFKKILFISDIKNQELKMREVQEKQKREYIHKLSVKDEEIEKHRKKNEEIDSVLWQSRQKESELLSKIQQKSKQIQRLENEIMDAKKAQPSSTTNKQLNNNNQQNVEQKLKEVENNNANLGLQIQQSQDTLSTFIKEMNELLDSHAAMIDLNEEIEIPKKKPDIQSYRTKH